MRYYSLATDMGRVCINMGRVYTDTPRVYSSPKCCVFFYTSYTFLLNMLIECWLQGVDRHLSTPYLHLFGIYLHLLEHFCGCLWVKYSLFGAFSSPISVFFQQKIRHSRFKGQHHLFVVLLSGSWCMNRFHGECDDELSAIVIRLRRRNLSESIKNQQIS